MTLISGQMFKLLYVIYLLPYLPQILGHLTVLQLGFEGRGVLGRELFAQSYKNEGTICHVMCLVSRHVTKYNTIPQ